MSKPHIAIVDYGMGNRRSVEKALQKVGAEAVITGDCDEILTADGAILPGVGAFPEAMRRLGETRLDQVVIEYAGSGKQLLGICLGMQLLFDTSSEFEQTRGLGLLRGAVQKLNTAGEKLPHIGWNRITWQRASALTDGLGEAADFYHVHSFAAQPQDGDDVVGLGDYGLSFVSVVQRDNVHGVQFHPEKSSRVGLQLLTNFVKQSTR